MNEWESARERFLEDCRDAVRISRENLRRLMEDNKDTEYGRRHGFAAIRDGGVSKAGPPVGLPGL